MDEEKENEKMKSLILSTYYRDYKGNFYHNFINDIIFHQNTSIYTDHDGICVIISAP
jgi:hypothetical protein